MKLSDYVADFLSRQGIRHVFAVSGGASLHLIHSLADHPDIDYVCPQHEQGGAMMADAYARTTGGLGAAVATSGPGATNMITGICSSYYDSVPVIYLTGQVASFRNKADTGVRQIGFQETDVVGMCRPVTKYAAGLERPDRIRYELEKAVHIARTGRPGPVLIDIPDDFQRAQIDPAGLEPFIPEVPSPASAGLAAQVETIAGMLARAERPVVILGWGVRLAGAEREALAVIGRLGAPVLPTWAMLDFLSGDHPLLGGSFGTHGTRYGNFTLQNADLVLSVGSRLDTHGVGSPFSDFARGAGKIVVDIDPAELSKFDRFGLTVDVPVAADARDFLSSLNARLEQGFQGADLTYWWERIRAWRRNYPIVCPEYEKQNALNPYVFVDSLSEAACPDDVVLVDTGCSVAWMSQAFRFKAGQRYFHAFNNTPMGYALPGAIGASLALGGRRVLCVTGDGGLQMNLQELGTAIRHDLPVKIFLLNNHGYSMIQQTQDQWLGAVYHASSVEGGLAFPDFIKVAEAYGYRTHTIETNEQARREVAGILAEPGPAFINVEIRPEERVIPQVKFGRPIEDPEPLLSREEFFRNMIVEPVEASRRG